MKKIIVRAPFLTQTGYGEHGRFVLRALRQYEDVYDIYATPIAWGQSNWLWEDNEERRWFDKIISKTSVYINNTPKEEISFDIAVQVTIPNEWEKLAPVNIGVTAGIEATQVSPTWIEKSLLMDKIITPSQFAADIYKNTQVSVVNNSTGEKIEKFATTTPFEAVHYPVRHFEPADIELGLDYDFNFLAVAQWGPRKNLENTIRWFVEEFIDKEVGLVVKTSYRKNCIMDRAFLQSKLKSFLSKYPKRKCKVYLLHGYMTDAEMTALYQDPKIKCLVTATHGEGFGLPIFEAAHNDMPVIAPNWSAYTEFMHMPVENKKGKIKTKHMFAKVDYNIQHINKEAVWPGVMEEHVMWAVPEQGSFKMKLREVYKDYGRFKSQAKKLGKWIRENFSLESKLEHMVLALTGEKLVKVETKDLPKISIITSVYNGDEFIEPFLEDITRQTIFEEKCELIIINANSPGNEEQVILEYQEKYPDNIVYKKLDEDPGIYGVWNMGVEMSTGEFLTNANLDDRKRVDSLERHAKALYASQETDLVYADSLITQSPNETYEDNSSNGNRYNSPQFSLEAMLRGNLPHSNPMWRKTLHDKNGLFDAKYKSAGDWEFWLRCAFAGSKFLKISDLAGLYYFNPKGISTNPENNSWKVKEELEIYKKYQKLYMQKE